MEETPLIETVPANNKRIVVIAPDKASGGDFAGTLFSRVAEKGFSVATYYSEISPRVKTDEMGKGRLTDDKEKVSHELADTIKRAIEDSGQGSVVIACNTLSLNDAFVDRAVKELGESGLKKGENYRILTTLDAIKEKFDKEGGEIPVILGTKVLSEELPREGLKTLSSLGHEDASDLSQEIIWRVKAVKGSDISTAPKYTDLNDETVLKNKVGEFVDRLKENGLDEVILGCTELPIAFKEYTADLKGIKWHDPADIVAERLEAGIVR